jgi:DNA-binding IclR family transcriptional regulator
MSNRDRDQSGIQSIEIAGGVLRALIEAGQPIPLREIAARAGIHPSKVHRYLVSLTRVGLVEQDAERGNYRAGALTVPLAFTRLRNLDFVAVAQPILTELRDETEETAVLSAWSEMGPVVLRLEECARPVFLNVRVGSILPLHRSATGLTFGAFLPDLQRDAALDLQIAQKRMTRAEAKAFVAALPSVREAHLASVQGSLVSGVSALASPIFDAGGRVVLVMGVLGQQSHFDTTIDGAVARALKAHARKASTQLGYAQPGL